MTKIIQCVQCKNECVSVEDTINSIKKAGFDGAFVQWYHLKLDLSQEEQLDMCKKLNFDIPFIHLTYKDINKIWLSGENGEKITQQYIDDLTSLSKKGVDLVIMHLSSKNRPPKPNNIGLTRLQKIVDHAEKLNIRIAFENTRKKGYLEFVFENIPNKNIGICFDTGHCHCFFNDEFDWNYFKNKILAIHIHDNQGEEDEHLLPFDGTTNWKQMMADIKSSGYNGPIVLESCYRNSYTNMPLDKFYKESYKRAKKLI